MTTRHAIGSVPVARVPADQAKDGGGHPEAGRRRQRQWTLSTAMPAVRIEDHPVFAAFTPEARRQVALAAEMSEELASQADDLEDGVPVTA